MSGRFSVDNLDTDLVGTRTICRATPRAWRAMDLKTQKAGLGMLKLLIESVSLRECEVVSITSLEVGIASLTELLKYPTSCDISTVFAIFFRCRVAAFNCRGGSRRRALLDVQLGGTSFCLYQKAVVRTWRAGLVEQVVS